MQNPLRTGFHKPDGHNRRVLEKILPLLLVGRYGKGNTSRITPLRIFHNPDFFLLNVIINAFRIPPVTDIDTVAPENLSDYSGFLDRLLTEHLPNMEIIEILRNTDHIPIDHCTERAVVSDQISPQFSIEMYFFRGQLPGVRKKSCKLFC